MCGICGLAAVDPREIPLSRERLLAMTDAMTHRGPDEAGYLRQPGIVAGMRRLSIIDLTGSHQPLANEDGTVQTVFNGEIFNFATLRAELTSAGHRLATSGDTETIVHLYEEHGREFVRALRGMFAIAVWDARSRTLTLARDRLGVKPLYYAQGANGLAFASEIKCLLAAGLVTPRLDLEAAELFLALGYVPAPRTLFAGVSKLPPATTMQWRAGELSEPRPYWTPYEQAVQVGRSWEEDQERLLELLRDAVRMRMASDVPLGVMLSGGLDSSLIAALMTEAAGRVSTFSIGFREDADANELAWARRTATRLGAEHHELITSVSDHEDLLDDALWHLEEPIVDLSFLGFWLLSRLARESVTVALCGQAADELLGGYHKHLAARASGLAASWPSGLRRAAARVACVPDERARRTRFAAAITAEDDIDRLLAMSRVVTPTLRSELRGPALPEQDPAPLLRSSIAAAAGPIPDGTRLGRMLALDLRLALPDLMFMYFDKMSMAASLEVRVPFADHELVSFCLALPDDRRIRRLRGKEILRRVSSDLVEQAIIDRPKRGFFRSASASWLEHRRPSVIDTLLSERCRERGVLNPGVVERWLDRPGRGGRTGEPLLAAFLLERWHQTFVDADGLAGQRARAVRRESGGGSARLDA